MSLAGTATAGTTSLVVSLSGATNTLFLLQQASLRLERQHHGRHCIDGVAMVPEAMHYAALTVFLLVIAASSERLRLVKVLSTVHEN